MARTPFIPVPCFAVNPPPLLWGATPILESGFFGNFQCQTQTFLPVSISSRSFYVCHFKFLPLELLPISAEAYVNVGVLLFSVLKVLPPTSYCFFRVCPHLFHFRRMGIWSFAH